MRISVLLEEELADRFERYCRMNGYKKSTLTARLIREHLDREQFVFQREFPLDSGASVPKRK